MVEQMVKYFWISEEFKGDKTQRTQMEIYI